MPSMSIEEFIARKLAAREASGWTMTPEMTEAMRNRGGQRTPSKRALLAEIDRRSEEAGLPVRPACY